jgi:hypothetical protein
LVKRNQKMRSGMLPDLLFLGNTVRMKRPG